MLTVGPDGVARPAGPGQPILGVVLGDSGDREGEVTISVEGATHQVMVEGDIAARIRSGEVRHFSLGRSVGLASWAANLDPPELDPPQWRDVHVGPRVSFWDILQEDDHA